MTSVTMSENKHETSRDFKSDYADWQAEEWVSSSLSDTGEASADSPDEDISSGQIKSFKTVDGMLDSLKLDWETHDTLADRLRKEHPWRWRWKRFKFSITEWI